MLGSAYGGNPYNEVAYRGNMTYFYSQNYNQLYNQYGEDYMRAINRHFLLI